jgi:hypothetical protein
MVLRCALLTWLLSFHMDPDRQPLFFSGQPVSY